MSVPIFSFFHWIVYFLIIEFSVFFMYFRHKSFISYVLCKYFLSVCSFFFILLVVSFKEQMGLILFKFNLSVCSYVYTFVVIYKKPLPKPSCKYFLLCLIFFYSSVFYIEFYGTFCVNFCILCQVWIKDTNIPFLESTLSKTTLHCHSPV